MLIDLQLIHLIKSNFVFLSLFKTFYIYSFYCQLLYKYICNTFLVEFVLLFFFLLLSRSYSYSLINCDSLKINKWQSVV